MTKATTGTGTASSGPHVQEVSKASASASMSSVTQRTNEKLEPSETGSKKIITRTEEEKSRTERQEQTNKIITGTWDEISSFLPKGTPKPVSSTETRKLAYTTATGEKVNI